MCTEIYVISSHQADVVGLFDRLQSDNMTINKCVFRTGGGLIPSEHTEPQIIIF